MSLVNITRDPYKGHVGPSASMNASGVLRTYLVERMTQFSILASVHETSASLAGALILQASNNAYLDNVNMDLNPDAVWVDIPNTTVTLTSGDTATMWNVADVGYESVRVSWTRTTGQGTFTSYFMAKG